MNKYSLEKEMDCFLWDSHHVYPGAGLPTDVFTLKYYVISLMHTFCFFILPVPNLRTIPKLFGGC